MGAPQLPIPTLLWLDTTGLTPARDRPHLPKSLQRRGTKNLSPASKQRAHARALIAKRAGLSSTGLISYHFKSRDELIEQVVTTIISLMGQFMGQQPSTAGVLRPKTSRLSKSL